MVYVDDMKAKFRGMVMSHMFADSDLELMKFAKRIGLKKEWKHNDHFDISQSKKAQAIELGAKLVTQHEMCAMVMERRGQLDMLPYLEKRVVKDNDN